MLDRQGIVCTGWDPAFQPAAPCEPADVVNLGYVLNVIEDVAERKEALRKSWELSRQLLIVSAQVHISSRGRTAVPFGDGVVTVRGTFQKFFDQGELKSFIEEELGTEAVPVEPGIFYLFRNESSRQQFMANRYRRRVATPRKRRSEVKFEEHRDLLEPFMAAIASLGRLPEIDEYSLAGPLLDQFGSFKRAFALIRRVTGAAEWKAITQRCTEDLLIYLALVRFRKRPPMSVLPVGLQRDIRSFFGNYSNACRQADDLLFRAGSAEAVDEACRRSVAGKLLPNALYVHRTALESLDPLLRTYEGCARAFLGEIEGANLIKLHRHSGKVSYLVYPGFETDPHPALLRSVKLSLRTREIDCLEYGSIANPPILHRKESFLTPDHPLHTKFARLTQQEERHGLLDETASIGTRLGWESRLQEANLQLKGHRLVRKSAVQ